MGRVGDRAEVVVLAGRGSDAGASRRTLRLRWRIAQAGGGEATLECVVEEPTGEEPQGSLAFALEDGAGRRGVACGGAGRVSWVRDAASGLEHVDAPGLLACSFERTEGGGVRVLYARTPVLGGLGAGGGRHELAGAEVGPLSPTAVSGRESDRDGDAARAVRPMSAREGCSTG
ncbi:MAG: hypothetical protein KJZ54_03120 [Phycisphaerales bacterium]|nr:hypothetical protein [Phycisphaerales bacterium]